MKKKGFTLVELIAVLIILAILSLVVVPLVLNIIRSAKNSVNKRSIDGYGRAVDLAIANYLVNHLTYPESFDELEIEYTGSKVECKTSRINPDKTVYLSECKVNGRLVKDNKEIDGYYHYGILKMTNQEYVDTYGKNLEGALKAYHDEHNEYPNDYTTLELPPLDKEVSCDVETYSDGKIYLTKCFIDGDEVLDDTQEDGYYHYGIRKPFATEYLVNKANGVEINAYTSGNTHEMYTFDHEVTVQTPVLRDYRYIGNSPYNYVAFNENETWRIIGVFSVDDGNGNYEERVKLIRNESVGNKQWNSSNQNEWVGSSIQTYLNDTYTIDNKSRKMIASSKIYLGGLNYGGCINCAPNGESFYISERSETTCYGRNASWVGKTALMYPSDYIFTYAVGVDDTCYNTPGNCNVDSEANPSSGWLYRSEYFQWTMTPNSYYTTNAFKVDLSGVVHNYSSFVDNFNGISPVVYLKSGVKIKSGDGSIDNPYIFEL